MIRYLLKYLNGDSLLYMWLFIRIQVEDEDARTDGYNGMIPGPGLSVFCRAVQGFKLAHQSSVIGTACHGNAAARIQKTDSCFLLQEYL